MADFITLTRLDTQETVHINPARINYFNRTPGNPGTTLTFSKDERLNVVEAVTEVGSELGVPLTDHELR